MAENAPTNIETAPPAASSDPAIGKTPKKLTGKWFRKIPRDKLFSTGGISLAFLAAIMEAIDWIPVPGIDVLTWELALELIFITLLITILKVPWQSMILPFTIERIPGLSDIIPSFLLIFLK